MVPDGDAAGSTKGYLQKQEIEWQHLIEEAAANLARTIGAQMELRSRGGKDGVFGFSLPLCSA